MSKSNRVCRGFINRIVNRALKKIDVIEKGEFLFLLFFVGVPIPGTGAWTESNSYTYWNKS